MLYIRGNTMRGGSIPKVARLTYSQENSGSNRIFTEIESFRALSATFAAYMA